MTFAFVFPEGVKLNRRSIALVLDERRKGVPYPMPAGVGVKDALLVSLIADVIERRPAETEAQRLGRRLQLRELELQDRRSVLEEVLRLHLVIAEAHDTLIEAQAISDRLASGAVA